MNYKNRFVIVDGDGKVVEDAHGYGYTSKNAAEKARWYHFGGGKEKISSNKTEAKEFWNSHRNAAKDLTDLFETWFKEIFRGEIEEKDLVEEISKKYSIIIPLKYLEYLK